MSPQTNTRYKAEQADAENVQFSGSQWARSRLRQSGAHANLQAYGAS
jgi:hypothetical protein